MQSDNLRGILLMVASMALFAMEDMFIKLAAIGIPTGEIVLLSGLFGIPIFAAMAWRSGKSVWVRAAWQPAVMIRNVGEMVGSIAYVTALATVPLPTVSAVLQAMPLVVTMGAALFLGATVGWRRWTAIAVGFAGVLLVIRPGLDGFRPAALWVLFTVVGLAVRDLASRAVPVEFSSAQVSAWGAMAITLLGVMMMAGTGKAVMPDFPQAMYLILMGIFGSAGYWAITAATRTGEVATVAPFRYARLVFAIIIGWLMFSEPADTLTLSGAGLIIASGLYSFARERKRKSLSTAAPAL
ncbi:MAG: DMT family transporter [Paracoccaceae bacterium]